MKVRLIPTTSHGENNLVSHGAIWTVVKEMASVDCLDGKPGYLLKSVRTGNTRWLQKNESRHYTIEVVAE